MNEGVTQGKLKKTRPNYPLLPCLPPVIYFLGGAQPCVCISSRKHVTCGPGDICDRENPASSSDGPHSVFLSRCLSSGQQLMQTHESISRCHREESGMDLEWQLSHPVISSELAVKISRFNSRRILGCGFFIIRPTQTDQGRIRMVTPYKIENGYRRK